MKEATQDATRVIEGWVDYSEEDGGCATIAEVSTGDEVDDVFVRIQEWHDDPARQLYVPSLEGRRVRVTIEVLP